MLHLPTYLPSYKGSDEQKRQSFHIKENMIECVPVKCKGTVITVSLSLSHTYPASGVVLDCIDSWSLHPYFVYRDEHAWLTESKVRWHGIVSIDWFKTYLANIQQVVNINGATLSPSYVKRGIPRGSKLGPLLFLCYVNYMYTSVSADCKWNLYADDSGYYLPITVQR